MKVINHCCLPLVIAFCNLLILLPNNSVAQSSNDNYRSDTDKLTAEFHRQRREVLRSNLPDSSCAIIFAAPERIRSADVDYKYHQNPDFYYLTGLNEPNALLIIWKQFRLVEGVKTNEIIFVQPRNASKEKWYGKRLGTTQVRDLLGITNAYSSEDFDSMQGLFTGLSQILYQGIPKGIVNDRQNKSDLFDLVESFQLKSEYPTAKHDDFLLGKALRSMREIKTPEEIKLLQKAAEISVVAHTEMMKALNPAMTEFKIQAVGEYFFKSMGAEAPAYPSICGAAENSCILHYQTNRRILNDGDLLLLDMGAEYHGYAADITRTLPVNGKFSELQSKIYQLVLDAQKAAIAKCIPGNKFSDPDKAARNILSQGLLKMQIIKTADELDQYFPHGTSHFLGLDVHDVGSQGTLKSGMLITVEPGLYFPEGSPCDPALWNIGIRIEDDILITNDGFINLSGALTREIDEMEKIIKEKSIFEEN